MIPILQISTRLRALRALALASVGATVATAVGTAPSSATGPTTMSHGLYVDNAGTTNAWSVNQAHTLIWNDKPFVPVGGRFQAKSWSATATDADWDSDRAALTTLKAQNITDIYVQPVQGGLTSVPPKSIQRMIDYLDQEGFTYGISINDCPQGALAAYLVRPGAYRQVVAENTSDIRFTVDGLNSALYFVVSPDQMQVVQSGEATMTSDGALISTPGVPTTTVAFLIPHKSYVPGANSTMGLIDLWDHFDSYRDSLLALFRNVRLGKGFRFFVDALPANLSVSGDEIEHLVPTSNGFTTEWSAWLGRKYRSVNAVEEAWAIQERDLKDIDEAAHLVPLWGGQKGLEEVYDRLTGHRLKVDTAHSSIWRDLNQFKEESVRGYMSDLANVLKKAVADVPVVYRSSGQSSLFANLPSDIGFDGIGIDAYGRGSELVRSSAGNIYAEAADAFKTMWLPVTATADSGPVVKPAKGYATQLSMSADFDWLREIGARGFYVDGVRIADPARKNFDLSDAPDQLSWLASYQKLLVATGISAAKTVPDNIIYYPRALLSAPPRQLGNEGWWLPTDRQYVSFDFGIVGRAYSFSENGETVYYLYNPAGKSVVHIDVPKASQKTIAWSPLAAGDLHKDKLTLTIGPDPVRITRLASIPVPTETIPALLGEGAAIIKILRSENSLYAGKFQEDLATIPTNPNIEQPWSTVLRIQAVLTEMRGIVRPYAWIEAEDTKLQTFDEVSDRAGASGNQVLLVEPRSRGSAPAIATYPINIRETAPFEVWVAASPGAPLSFRLDGQALLDTVALPETVGAPYANGTLVWMHYGSATLPKGPHNLEMRANGPAAVDTILLMHGGTFVPDGPNPPPVVTLVPETHDKARKR